MMIKSAWKRGVSLLLCVALILGFFAGIVPKEVEAEELEFTVKQNMDATIAGNDSNITVDNTITAGVNNDNQYGLQNPMIKNGVVTWDCIYFGNYNQSNTSSKEPIKWRVLEIDGSDAFIMSDLCLDQQTYNITNSKVTWETCSLRKWMNTTFLNAAFNETEQSSIKDTLVENPDNYVYGTEGGNDTVDKIYLLSVDEVKNAKYGFINEPTRIACNTYYAMYNGATNGLSGLNGGYWRLRTLGLDSNYASSFNQYGEIDFASHVVTCSRHSIRPVLHLDLSKSGSWSHAGTISSEKTHGYWTYTILNEAAKTAKITGYTGNETDIVIPANVGGYSVTVISDEAFRDCDKLTSIDIPEGVTSIESFAFYSCDNLTSVEIPQSVTSIGYCAFSNCSELTSIDLPGSVTTIDGYAFESCWELTSITIPERVTNIKDGAFRNCRRLKNIEVAESNAKFKSKDGVVYNKNGTELICYPAGKGGEVTVLESVTSIRVCAFYGCQNLTSIEIPQSVTNIGTWAFAHCENLTSISIPENVKNIEDDAFKYCDNLTIHTKPGSVAAQYAEDYNIPWKAQYELNGSNITVDDTVTADDLYKKYPGALSNSAHTKMISMIYEDCAGAIDRYNSNLWKTGWASFKYGLTDGPEVVVKSALGSLFGKNTIYREFMDEEVEDLLRALSGNNGFMKDLIDEVGEQNDIVNLVKDFSKEAYTADEKGKLVNALAKTKKLNQTTAKRLCTSIEEIYPDIKSMFKKIGISISVADCIITVAQFYSIKAEMVDTLMEAIPKDTDLYDSLLRIKKKMESEDYLAWLIGEEYIFDKLASVIASNAAYGGIRIFSDIVFEEASPALFFGELTVKLMSKIIPTASGDDLVKANMNTSIFNLLDGAVRAKYIELCQLKEQGASDVAVKKAQADYEVVYRAHIESLKKLVDISSKITESTGLKKFYEFFNVTVVFDDVTGRYHKYLETDKTLLKYVSYDEYINSCLTFFVQRYASQYYYAVKDGKATITGCSINQVTKNSDATYALPAKATQAITYNSILILPDEVEGIPVTAIATDAFAGVLSHAVVVLPDSIERIEQGAFDSDSSLLFVGTASQDVEAYAAATNNVAHVMESKVSSIQVTTPPIKTTYTGDELLDETGMKLKVVYEDGTETELESGWYSYIENRVLGTNTVTVAYADCTTSYSVTVAPGDVNYAVYYKDIEGNLLLDQADYTGVYGDTITVQAVDIPYYTPEESEKELVLKEHASVTFVYSKDATTNIEDADVTVLGDHYYTEKPIEPEVRVMLGETELQRDIDYEVTYFANTDVGTAEILVSGMNLYSGDVIATFPIQAVMAQNITLDTQQVTLTQGETKQLLATILPENTTNKGIEWTSTNPSIATVDEKGVVVAIANGCTEIYAKTTDGTALEAKCVVTVAKPEQETEATTAEPTSEIPTTEEQTVAVTDISITGISKTIMAGKKINLTANITPTDATNKAVKWTSSNKKYAAVNSKGIVTTKKKGAGKIVTITATAKDGSGVKCKYKIKLVKHGIKSIKFKVKTKTVNAFVGKPFTLKTIIQTTGKTAYKKLIWTSSNKKYAIVSSKGKVTVKKAGIGKSVVITAKAADGTGKIVKIRVKIKKAK